MKQTFNIAAYIMVAMFFFACKISEREELGEKATNFPSRTVIDAELYKREQGFLQVEMNAPIIEEFGFVDSPYTLFSEGIDLKFFSSKEEKSPGTLRADWALFREKVGLYHAEGDVVMVNPNGDTIKTQSIFWDTKKKRIYTEDTVVILRANYDSLMARNGLNAREDLKEYTLFSHTGLFHVDSTSL